LRCRPHSGFSIAPVVRDVFIATHADQR
jgi:hypothetical protein